MINFASESIFETSVPNNWMIENNEPSHCKVTWIEDSGWDWVLCSHALKYFLAKIFVTPTLVVLHPVLEYLFDFLSPRLLGFELHNLLKDKFANLSIIPP